MQAQTTRSDSHALPGFDLQHLSLRRYMALCTGTIVSGTEPVLGVAVHFHEFVVMQTQVSRIADSEHLDIMPRQVFVLDLSPRERLAVVRREEALRV